MKTLIKFIPVLTILVLLFALPVPVLAQEPPPGQTFSGDQLVLGENYTLRANQVLNGTLVVVGGNAVIEENATVNGDIAMIGGNLDFSGTVSGSISAIGGNVSLSPSAVVRGDVDSFGGNVSGANQATIYGKVNTMTPRAFLFNADRIRVGPLQTPEPVRVFGSFFRDVIANILQILAVAILALIVALVMPKPLDRVARSISAQPLLSGGTGLLTLAVSPLVLLIMVITILLIPVAFLALLVLGIAVLFGWIAIGYEIGRRLAELFKTTWAEPISAGLGTLVLGTIVWLLGFVFCLGGLLSILVACVGLGGIILSKFGTQVYSTSAAAPPPYTPPSVSPPEMDASNQGGDANQGDQQQ